MDIHELRKTASKNKKYRFIYQLIIAGKVVVTRRSSIDYIGVWVDGKGSKTRYHWFMNSTSIKTVIAIGEESGEPALALTFDELVKYKNLNV